MNIALILCGGRGVRMGTDIPKQYIKVGERPIFSYCVESLSAHSQIDAISIVANTEWHELIVEWLKKYDKKGKFRGFSCPGLNRQLSIYNGLCDIKRYADDKDYVMIHDAVRPLLSEKLIEMCFCAVTGRDGVMPGLPVKDTVYASADGKSITGLLNRKEIYAGQAPEVFRLGSYYDANRKLLPKRICEINGSTEPAIIAGMDIAIIAGDENNFKITTKSDLNRFIGVMEMKGEISGERYNESLGASRNK